MENEGLIAGRHDTWPASVKIASHLMTPICIIPQIFDELNFVNLIDSLKLSH